MAKTLRELAVRVATFLPFRSVQTGRPEAIVFGQAKFILLYPESMLTRAQESRGRVK
jgi:hypothetical protein